MIKTAKAMQSGKKEETPYESPLSQEDQDLVAAHAAKATPKMRATARAMVQTKPQTQEPKAEERQVSEESKEFLAPYVAAATPSMRKTAHAMEHGKYPEPEDDHTEKEILAMEQSLMASRSQNEAADAQPRRTTQLKAEEASQSPEEEFDFSTSWDGHDDEEEYFDFSTSWDGYDEEFDANDPNTERLPAVADESQTRTRRWKNRINSIRARIAMATVGDFKGALAGDPEKTRRISRKLLIGASAVALAGVAAVFIKRGDIDLLPSKGRFGDGDGIGIDLFGRKLGSGTNHATALWQDNPLAGKPGVNVGTTSAPEAVTQAWVDQVKPGDGITNSIMDYASQHGKPISPDRAFEVFNKLKPSITGNSITGSTPMNVIGDIGYAAPGQSTWSPEMIERMNELLGL
jgi:hypothetical protein